MAQRLDEWLVGSQGLLRACAEQDRGAFGVCACAELGNQPGLADSGVAGYRLPLGLGHPGLPQAFRMQAISACRPTNVPWAERSSAGSGIRSSPTGLPTQLARATGWEKPFNDSSPSRRKSKPPRPSISVRTTSEARICALRAVAQALGHHHRGSEEVIRVTDRLARMQADPYSRAARSARAGCDARPPAGFRPRRPARRGSAERDHQSVAEALDFLPGVTERDIAQQTEMRATQSLGQLVAEVVEQLGRAHEIGEQEGQGSCRRSRRGDRDGGLFSRRLDVGSALRSSSASALVTGDGAIRTRREAGPAYRL